MWQSLLTAPWWIPVVIYVIVGYVGMRWLMKRLVDMPDQIVRLTVNFVFCSVIAATVAILTGTFRFDTATYQVMAIGVINGLANIAFWRATKISMSKTHLMSFGDDIVAVLLTIIIVGDGRYLNSVSTTGMLLCLLAGFLFWYHNFKGGEKNTLYVNIAIYSVLWGIAIALTRYFAFSNLPVAQFALGWYLGSALTICSIFLWRKFVQKEGMIIPLRIKDVGLVFVFASGIVGCLYIEYWAFILAPGTVVIPIFLTAEAIIPAIIGWTIFKEGGTFDRYQWCFAGVGIIGTVFLGLGFHG